MRRAPAVRGTSWQTCGDGVVIATCDNYASSDMAAVIKKVEKKVVSVLWEEGVIGVSVR